MWYHKLHGIIVDATNRLKEEVEKADDDQDVAEGVCPAPGRHLC